MSVIKDAERIGDYCKNINEVNDYHHLGDDRNDLVRDLRELDQEVEGTFQRVAKTFRESDEKSAQELIEREREVAKRCDDLLHRILKADNLSIPQAVAIALIARYLKRVAAHLGNIATSVVMPIHKLDYYDEDHLPPKSE